MGHSCMILGQSNQFLVHPFLYFYAGGQYSLEYYGILRVWPYGTTQIINKKRCGWRSKAIMKAEAADAGGDEKLTFKFMWP